MGVVGQMRPKYNVVIATRRRGQELALEYELFHRRLYEVDLWTRIWDETYLRDSKEARGWRSR
jgi:hypothetical protein